MGDKQTMRKMLFREPCEVCGANPFWWNTWERDRHVHACEAIKKGLDSLESRANVLRAGRS